MGRTQYRIARRAHVICGGTDGRLERAVAPESLCDEDTQTGDGPMVPAVGWASSWAVVQVACKEKGLELVGFLWFEVRDQWRCRDAARCQSFLDVGRETSAGCQKQSRGYGSFSGWSRSQQQRWDEWRSNNKSRSAPPPVTRSPHASLRQQKRKLVRQR